jgi:hypothetical protein
MNNFSINVRISEKPFAFQGLYRLIGWGKSAIMEKMIRTELTGLDQNKNG